MNKHKHLFCLALLIGGLQLTLNAQNSEEIDPEWTEKWNPVPAVVDPGGPQKAPSDAIVLFDGTDLSQWQHEGGKPASWEVKNGYVRVKQKSGDIYTKQSFGDMQLHMEWRSPYPVRGEGQQRGNSGVFLMGIYEVQVLDNFDNKTYVNGQAGSVYKQHIPLVNACRKPGEWQSYDIIFTAPSFYENGMIKEPARVTVLHNGVLIQNNVSLWGTTEYRGLPKIQPHEPKLPLRLQDHGDPGEQVSFRNIWVRPL